MEKEEINLEITNLQGFIETNDVIKNQFQAAVASVFIGNGIEMHPDVVRELTVKSMLEEPAGPVAGPPSI